MMRLWTGAKPINNARHGKTYREGVDTHSMASIKKSRIGECQRLRKRGQKSCGMMGKTLHKK